MQDALWKHAVIERRENKLPNSKDCVSFIPNSCLLTENKTIQSLPNNFTKDALELEKRKYRLTRKPRVPHTWRTRKDPFEKVWADICLQLENEPERTAKSLFDDLLVRYPRKFQDGQLRTLQRRVKAWCAKALLTFNYPWLTDMLREDYIYKTELKGNVSHEAVL